MIILQAMYGGSETGDIYMALLKVPQSWRSILIHTYGQYSGKLQTTDILPSLFLLVLYVLMAFIFNGMAAIGNISV
jgi:hypothetical protein